MASDTDEAQNQRIARLESRMDGVDTKQAESDTKLAVMDVRVEGFEKALDTGIIRLETALKTAVTDQTAATVQKATDDREERQDDE